jgi:hypothetical protein
MPTTSKVQDSKLELDSYVTVMYQYVLYLYYIQISCASTRLLAYITSTEHYQYKTNTHAVQDCTQVREKYTIY